MSKTIGINSPEELTELVRSGFKIQRLEIGINDMPNDHKHNPLNMTLRELFIHALEARAEVSSGQITTGDEEEPSLMYVLVVSTEAVAKARKLLEKL